MQRYLMMNTQFRRFRPLRGSRPLADFGPLGVWPSGFQKAGLDIGTRLLPLENGDLVPQLLDSLFQLLDAVLLDTNDPQQRLNQRRPFLGPNLGKLQLHASQILETRPAFSCAKIRGY